ncbi:hypothetical protein HSBAA_29250 [Vreelandella sulfidaeris]|uniref:Uncharacterized protein n=1 Tax=Vreelandella sulfidaeris TaxID=115553 RepID=A0A455UAP6_9GAMM|nr:hypothetical protein HSBAA_29250 [Halomonas sulfidaeris]
MAAIASQTRDNGVFEICVVPDNLGRVTIGQPLHLSVLSPDVWIALVEAHFVVEKYSQPSPTSLTIVVKNVCIEQMNPNDR